MSVSLQDIATDLNVSVSLVSKVINGRMGTTGVRKEIVDAIHKHAQELGYIKNRSAASLREGKQNTIGIFVHQHGMAGSSITEAVVKGAAETARLQHQRLLLTYYSSIEQFASMAPQISPVLMDGLIVAGHPHPEMGSLLRDIQKRGIPVVTVLNRPLHKNIANIIQDQVKVGELATSHLIEQGCRRIVNIKVKCGSSEMDYRHNGYLNALAKAKIPLDPALVHVVDGYTLEMGEQVISNLTKAGTQYDAIFAESDELAAGAINALHRAGRRIPEEIRVVGVDNSPYCRLLIVPLTSVSQEDLYCGELAAEHLLALVSGKKPPIPEVTPKLIIRASTVLDAKPVEPLWLADPPGAINKSL